MRVKFREHFQTKASCYPADTDGLLTPNMFEKTKEDSNRKKKKPGEVYLPHPLHPRPPSTPAVRRGARAASVPHRYRGFARFVEAAQQYYVNKIVYIDIVFI